MEENVKVDFEEEKAEVITVPAIKVSYGSIDVDFSDFKRKVAKRVEFFKSLTLSNDNVKVVENARADLNRTAKQLNDYRISVEKDFNKPFEDFKKNIKDVCDLLLDASYSLDVQLKSYEEVIKNEKINKIKELYDAIEEKPYFLTFDHVFNKKWLNKTYDFPRIKQDLELAVLKTKEDSNKLTSAARETENEVDIISNYLSQLTYENIVSGVSYANALAWYHNALEQAKLLKEQKERAEAEKARREQEAYEQAVVNKPVKATGVVAEKKLDIVLELKGVTKDEAVKLDKFLRENKYNYRILN